MGKTITVLWVCAMLLPASAFAWSVAGTTEYPDETHYTVKCEGGGTATVKQMHPQDPKKAYSNGWWFVVGGSYFNYPTQEAAVKVACKYPR